MAALNPRRSGRGKRLMADINVVPYIDVMLVLLVIFMVTAPLVPPGQIDLPRAGKSNTKADAYIEVQVRPNGDLRLRSVNSGDSQERRITRKELAGALQDLRGQSDLPVVISGDKESKYDDVIQLISEAKKMGINRVGLATK